MSRSTISLSQLTKMFPDEERARTYMEGCRWPSGAVCPACNEAKRITPRPKGFYRCNACKKDFTVRTGTIFERSHISLDKWILAIYLLMTARKGVSSLQLGKEIGVTQKSAWFMLGRLREACGNDPTVLRGIVEIDETYIGGKELNKHSDKKINRGRGAVGKTPVLGVLERGKGGRTKAKPIKRTDSATLHSEISENVQTGSTLHTDEHGGYLGLGGMFYNHERTDHSAGEYVRDDVTTNSIESVWAVTKRGLHGVYHHASQKRLASLVSASFGLCITYKELPA